MSMYKILKFLLENRYFYGHFMELEKLYNYYYYYYYYYFKLSFKCLNWSTYNSFGTPVNLPNTPTSWIISPIIVPSNAEVTPTFTININISILFIILTPASTVAVAEKTANKKYCPNCWKNGYKNDLFITKSHLRYLKWERDLSTFYV